MSYYIEHFLFFPVVVLLSIVLVVLTFKLIVRLFFFFVAILALWYCLSLTGVVPSPKEILKDYKSIIRLSEEKLGGDVKSY